MTNTRSHQCPAPDPRYVPLEGGFNVRDFGGQLVADGRQVALGRLYRSGTMALLTSADEDRLRGLGIQGICDFRRDDERLAEPTVWHKPAGIDYWARSYQETSGVLSAVLKDAEATPEGMREAMIALYREIPRDHAPSFVRMFELIAEGGIPLLINCSAGKDRTGVAAALILTILGVSRVDIESDYLATNVYADWGQLFARRDTVVARTSNRDPAIIAPLLRADKAYLDTMFTELDTSHGGVPGYLSSIGIDTETQGRVCDVLLVRQV